MQVETLTDDPSELLPELTLQVWARKFSEEDVKKLNFAEHKKIYRVSMTYSWLLLAPGQVHWTRLLLKQLTMRSFGLQT